MIIELGLQSDYLHAIISEHLPQDVSEFIRFSVLAPRCVYLLI